MPEIYRTILFFILCAIFSPGFSEFMYFFQLDVVKLSKFQYAMFGVLGYASLTFGTLFYNLYLKEMEVRTNLFYGCVIGVIG